MSNDLPPSFITEPALDPTDPSIDQALRPTAWDEYVGQAKIRENLKVIIEAARMRKESMDHVLFSGPAGLGKTTLAYLVAKEMGAQVKTTSGPALEKMGDMAAILTNLEPNDVLFIDEAHRINRMIEEVLYPAMEARKLHIMIGKGPSARSLTIDLPPFTLIAATTRENLLSHPLRSRFGGIFRLEFYSPADIRSIIKRSANIFNIEMTAEAVDILARASRATPRVANRLLKRARDFAAVKNKPAIDEETAKATLELLDIDSVGLEPHDRRILEVIIQKFGGGPVGVNSIAAALSEERGVIEDIYEPYLMTLGFLQRTPSGRVVLPAAYEHLGLKNKGKLL
jgi:Holliday junction DNA helicase RuvB